MIEQKFIDKISAWYLLAIAVIGLLAYMNVSPSGPETLPTSAAAKLKDPPEKALGLAMDMIKQVTTLSTGLIAMAIWLLKRPLTDEYELKQRVAIGSAAIVLLSASLYFGFIATDGALTMASFGVFDAEFDMVWRPQTIQYYCFVGGALCLGLACIRSINAIRDPK